MLEGNQGALLELLQWFFKTLGDHSPVPNYDPKVRRAVSKHGGCDRIPRFGASEAAFKRWAMKGTLDSHATQALSQLHPTLRLMYLRGAEAASEQYGMDGHHNGSRHAEHRHRGTPPQHRAPGAPREYHSHLHAGQLFRKTDVSSAAEHPRKRIIAGHQNGATRVRSNGTSSHAPLVSRAYLRRCPQSTVNRQKDWGIVIATGGPRVHIDWVQGTRDMSAALTVCDSASNALAERSDMLAGVARDLESGAINLCIARGCIRSLQNALITLVKHSSLLLKDVMLRLDVWNDASAVSMRRKVCSHASPVVVHTESIRPCSYNSGCHVRKQHLVIVVRVLGPPV